MGMAYSLTSHLVALLGGCKRFGHVWLLDKEQNCWVCDRCPTELWVSQMDSYRSRPYRRQNATAGYGNYYFDPRPAPEVRRASASVAH
jgi:hypothetical protein